MSDDFTIGQKTGDYEILGVLGAGGMGKVYKVRNTISDRVEAMKVILANLSSQKDLADRFLREIKVLASLNHPNIASLRTALTIDNRLVMIMEYVDGSTLASHLERGPIPAADAVNYTAQILAALSYAHGLGVIHRDIKPANMILTPAGIVKLMDFGIARPTNDTSMTMTGTALGSLNYMSPEQVKGEQVDPRSDLYSLGVSLYEMVTGQLPFRGHSNYSVMSAHLQETPEPPLTVRPDLPKGLNDIILMSMSKDPKDRFQSADAFRNALKAVMPEAVQPAPAVVMSPAVPITPARPLPAAVPITPAAASAGSRPIVTATPPQAVPAATIAAAASASTSAPGVAPIPAATAASIPPASGSQRGIYMALGGVLVLAMLAGAAVYIPRHVKTQANTPSKASPAPSVTIASPDNGGSVNVGSDGSVNITAPSQPPATDSAAAPPTSAAPAPEASSPAPPAPAPAVTHAAPSSAGSAAKHAQQAAAADAAAQQAAAENQAEQEKAAALADEEKQADQINARAASIAQGLDTLRRAQASQGLGLRGDIASAEELMKTNLSRAQSALDQRDPDKAKQYLDIAEAQAEKIEHFLGR